MGMRGVREEVRWEGRDGVRVGEEVVYTSVVRVGGQSVMLGG